MAKVEIVYCSNTGNTETCAQIIYNKLQSLGVDVKISDSFDTEANIFENAEVCVVGTYTDGEGQMPEDIIDFYEDLQELDLTGKIFGAFGSGDIFYKNNYCQNVIDFDEAFEKCGAKRGAELVKVQRYPDENAKERLEKFAEELASKIR